MQIRHEKQDHKETGWGGYSFACYLVPLEEKTVVGGLSARRYNPGKVAPGGFHSLRRVWLLTSLPFAIAQHLHPRESERRLLSLPPLPAGRAGWGIRGDRPMKPAFLRPGSGQRQGGRARTLKHTHTLAPRRARTRIHTCTRTSSTTRGGGNKEETGPSHDRLGCPPDHRQQRKWFGIAGRSRFFQVLLQPKSK